MFTQTVIFQVMHGGCQQTKCGLPIDSFSGVMVGQLRSRIPLVFSHFLYLWANGREE